MYNVGLKSIKNTLVIFRHFLLTTKTQNSSLQSDNCYDGVKSGVADAYLKRVDTVYNLLEITVGHTVWKEII